MARGRGAIRKLSHTFAAEMVVSGSNSSMTVARSHTYAFGTAENTPRMLVKGLT